MIEGDYEDTGQLELNFQFDRCERTCDRLVTYRQICAQVAREFGVIASFMPKPAVGLMANGCHHNLSLWRGDENVFVEEDNPTLHVSETARHALGGILEHSRGMLALLAPTVNSYARYWDLGQFAPAVVNWGFDNRTCAVRVSASGRLEYKLPDASVNPFISHAAVLEAMADGLERGIDPGAPQSEDSYGDSAGRFPPLPRTLGDALAALAEDEVVRGAPSRRAVRRVRRVQDRRVGAVLRHRDRVAPRDVPAGAAVSGLVADGLLTLCCADMDARPLFWTTPERRRDGLRARAGAAGGGACRPRRGLGVPALGPVPAVARGGRGGCDLVRLGDHRGAA